MNKKVATTEEREAHARYMREWRAANPEKHAAWKERNREGRKKRRKLWVSTHREEVALIAKIQRDKDPGRSRRAVSKWKKENPEKIVAQSRLWKALVAGRITRATACSSCGRGARIEGHHPDYNKPLEVIWLCRVCHRQLHGWVWNRGREGHYGSICE